MKQKEPIESSLPQQIILRVDHGLKKQKQVGGVFTCSIKVCCIASPDANSAPYKKIEK